MKQGDVCNLAGDIYAGGTRAQVAGIVLVTDQQAHVALWFGWITLKRFGHNCYISRTPAIRKECVALHRYQRTEQ